MHPNPAFRAEPRARHLAFARARAFGTLAVNAEAGPLLAHIPFLLNGDGTAADLHLTRSNPIARLGETRAILVVTGPDGYVSPDWYGAPDQVPTWNYVAIHFRGRLTPQPPETLRSLLDRQSADLEARLAPKPPWSTKKMSQPALDRMLRQILPFRLYVETLDGTWKLNQNKSADQRLAAAEHVAGAPGQEQAALAELMRSAGKDA